jgi:hypothetical protein
MMSPGSLQAPEPPLELLVAVVVATVLVTVLTADELMALLELACEPVLACEPELLEPAPPAPPVPSDPRPSTRTLPPQEATTAPARIMWRRKECFMRAPFGEDVDRRPSRGARSAVIRAASPRVWLDRDQVRSEGMMVARTSRRTR